MALLLVVMWWTVSIPVAIVVGRWIRGTPTPPTARPERTELLDRFLVIELQEIPRIRSAIAGWVDDPHLATRLQELRAESEMVARSLGLTSQGVTATPSLTRE